MELVWYIDMKKSFFTVFIGQSLVEVLFALALFFILVVGVFALSFRNFGAVTVANHQRDVENILQESFEAVQFLSYENWNTLPITVNPAGLSFSGGTWQLAAQPDLVDGLYQRSVVVGSVQRNASCNIVETGGTADPDTKLVTISVAWTINEQTRSKEAQKYLTNWKAPQTACGEEESDSLVIDVDGAYIGENHKALLGVMLRNIGDEDITLDKMQLSWTVSGKITDITIEEVKHWFKNGPGTPTNPQDSGTVLDMTDLVLEPGEEYEAKFRFDSFMTGAIFTITGILSDTSTVVTVTTPPDI